MSKRKDDSLPLSAMLPKRDKSPNELRMMLELAGVAYSDKATKAELEKLVNKI